MRQPDMVNEFRGRAAEADAQVRPVKDLAAAIAYTVKLTQELGGRTLAAPGWGEEDLGRIQQACGEAGLELFRQGLRSQADNIFCGLTPADWGVADTGTLVLDSASEDLRLATMLAEVHVAVLPVGRLRPDLNSLLAELDGLLKRSAAYLAFITGPSRTGDIELELTLGAHGPAQVHVLLLEEDR